MQRDIPYERVINKVKGQDVVAGPFDELTARRRRQLLTISAIRSIAWVAVMTVYFFASAHPGRNAPTADGRIPRCVISA